MMSTLLATKNESREFAQVKEAKGWYEYEPSYDGVIIHIDTAGAELLGYSSPDDVIGKKVNELYAHPFDHEKTLSMLFRDGRVHGFYTLMKSRKGKLFFLKQTSVLEMEGLYKCPLKIKSEFEIVQPMLSL